MNVRNKFIELVTANSKYGAFHMSANRQQDSRKKFQELYLEAYMQVQIRIKIPIYAESSFESFVRQSLGSRDSSAEERLSPQADNKPTD